MRIWLLLLISASLWAQGAEYDFYKEGREKKPDAYADELRKAGTPERMKPGVALDYAMGDGRNSLYLAKLGWTVFGFDISATGVTLAKRHAAALGLRIDAQVSSDASYDFGKERFDLILFSWSMPLVDVRKVTNALKPGGIVVMEFGPGFTGRNGMLRLFDDLVIERYYLTHAVSDFSDRRETDIFQLIARKELVKR